MAYSRSRPIWHMETPGNAARTMADMAAMVRAALRDPVVVSEAQHIVRTVTPRATNAQIAAIGRFLHRTVRFVSDPVGVQALHDPADSIAAIHRDGYMMGNCANEAMVAATLGLAVGITARFRAVGWEGPAGPFKHVITDLFGSQEWQPLDITRPAGLTPPTVTRTLLVDAYTGIPMAYYGAQPVGLQSWLSSFVSHNTNLVSAIPVVGPTAASLFAKQPPGPSVISRAPAGPPMPSGLPRPMLPGQRPAKSGGLSLSFGDTTPSWVMPAVFVGGAVLLAKALRR